MYDSIKPEKRNLMIEQIIRAEWMMFQTVGGIGGKMGCQEDWATFRIMRYSYYNAWSDQMIRSYAKDLDEAEHDKRNLIMEKYAYMMEFTDPEYYRSKLLPYFPRIDEDTRKMIDEIAEYLIGCDREFALRYPKLSRKGRPIEAAADTGKDTSMETYFKGELRTYSRFTLQFFVEYILKCKSEGINFAFLVKDKMVRMYGYSSIEDAECKL